MPLKNQILGRATIRLNSQVFDSEPGATIRPGGIKNTSRQLTDKFYFNQQKIPARITCKVPITPETSLRALQEMTGVEVTFTSDTGQTWIIREAVQVGDVEGADGDSGGLAPLEFEGDAAEEVKS